MEFISILKDVMAILFYAVSASAMIMLMISWLTKKSKKAIEPDVIDSDGRVLYRAGKKEWIA